VSSPAGAATRGIVRLSGPRACEFHDLVFRACGAPFPEGANYVAREGRLDLGGDWPPTPALAYVMRAPTSYTREDVVEFHTIGAVPIMRALLSRMLAAGARAAEPGEFTRRAYLNGRLDLAQAEAVRRIIHARSEAEHRRSLEQLTGSLSTRVASLRGEVIDLCAEIEAALDFSDQDIELISRAILLERAAGIGEHLAAIRCGPGAGALRAELPRVLLCGPPNVGKSSLFNALLRVERAIVSPHPGTTRDLIEATLAVDDLEFQLVDCAGIRESADELERMGSRRSRSAAETADILLLVLDASHPLDAQERRVLEAADPGRSLVVMAKCDLPRAWHEDKIRPHLSDVPAVATSTRTGEGILALGEALRAAILSGRADRSVARYLLEARHEAALARAAEALDRAREAADVGFEFVALELREVLAALGEIAGETVADDILDRIFSGFCIGK